jgi:DNA-binding CsgD family transcriptional regulator
MTGSVVTLVGRDRERRELRGLLDGIRSGRSAVRVVRGEAGMGKTVLVADALTSAVGFRQLRVSGAELRAELPYAGVRELCRPLDALIARLPGPQASALRVALGTAEGDAPDRLLVGLALLTLLSEAAEEVPTVCVVDDAQWVDESSIQALAFVARRIVAEPLALFFTARDRGAQRELAGLPELVLRGLDRDDSRALLVRSASHRLDERVLETILAEAAGNPLVLVELRAALSTVEAAGGFGLADGAGIPPPARVESLYGRRVGDLPPATRTLLLVLAAESTGRTEWVSDAAASLGVDVGSAVHAAVETGLVHPGGPLAFCHPLIRGVVYRTADPKERRRAHAALADALTGSAAEDHRAWHRGHAAAGPDKEIAGGLERAAARAQARGGVAAAAAFLAFAADLTPTPTRRARRRLDAAQATLEAGAPEAATTLVDSAEREVGDDDLLTARVALLRAKLAFAARRGADAPPLLLAAAGRLAQHDAALARETYLEAVVASVVVGRLAGSPHGSAHAIARAARSAPPAPGAPRAADLLLDGLTARLVDGHGAAAPVLTRAVAAYLREDVIGPRWYDAHRVCLDLMDQENYNLLAARETEALREAGALTALPLALSTYAGVCVTGGNFVQAATLLDEATAIVEAIGAPVPPSMWAYLAAYRGQEELCLRGVATTVEGSTRRGEGYSLALALYARSILHNGLGRHPEAFAAAAAGAEYDDLGIGGYLLVELVETACRCGEVDTAKEALRQVVERANATGSVTALGVAARSTALVSGGGEADAAFREAVGHLQRSPAVVYLARTHLVYGEWLRREGDARRARDQLRTAHEMFSTMGAAGFARRAATELAEAGESVRGETSGAAAELTPQERHIASLARGGLTNAEIAGQLFLSPRTVEWHLGRIFGKLGLSSRRELRELDAF